MWKTSYRLGLNRDKVFLQGWAIVENTTEDDWNHVQLGLISGRPISFQMDLYEPLFVPRPVVEPELFASLRPPTYQGNLDEEGKKALVKDFRKRSRFDAEEGPAGRFGGGGGGAPKPAVADGAARRLEQPGEAAEVPAKERQALSGDGLDLSHVASAAGAAQLGDYFQYAIKEPVTLARQKSALLPIINQDVHGSRVSIYNETVQPKFPLLGLRFQNNTPLHLSQGPITVFENNAYAGDSRIPDIQPNETHLLSYAIDLGTEVEPQKTTSEMLTAVKIVKGILNATYRLREAKTYVVKNRSESSRTVLIEHPFRSQFKLVEPAKPSERTRDVYRFEVVAEPGKPVKQEVVEELPRVQQIVLTNCDDETVRFYIRASASSERVKNALQQALSLKAKVNAAVEDVQREEKALHVIEQDQQRMRANMQRLPPSSDVYKRYLRKFEDQETAIEKSQAEIVKRQQVVDQARKTYDDYIAGLEVD
jgi:hypothetical protein